MGVSGVTLLMLVTMVLTSSPAFGRSSELKLAGSGLPELASERYAPTEAAESRIGGKRVAAHRHVRPSGQRLAVFALRLIDSIRAARSAVAPSVERQMWPPDEIVQVSWLSLPPPRA
jgi:hypothetical protein